MAEAVGLRLEVAQSWLEAGKPSRVLRSLPPRSSIPVALRPQHDFLEAEAWRMQGFLAKARVLYGRLLSSLDTRNDPALWTEAALSQTACHRSLGSVKEAEARLRQIQRVARTYRLSVFAPRIELERTLVDRAAGRYEKSLRRLATILQRQTARRAWDEAAFTLWAVGGARRFQGDLRGSLRAFEKSFDLACRTNDEIAKAYALFGLGGVSRVLGRLRDSARYYASAGGILYKTEDVFGKAYAQCGLANALRQLGKLTQAEAHYRKSHVLYSRLGDDVDLAYVEWGLGKIYLQQGKLPQARSRFERALKLFSRHHESRGIVLAALALSQVFHALGLTQRAVRFFDEALACSRQNRIHAHLEVFT